MCLPALGQGLHQKDLQQKLRDDYESQFLALRSPDCAAEVRLDQDGHNVGRPEPCPLAIGGLLKIDHVDLKGNLLHFKTHRVLLAEDDLRAFLTPTMAEVVLTFKAPPAARGALDAAMKSAFLSPNDLATEKQAYWHEQMPLTGNTAGHGASANGTPIGFLEAQPVYLVQPSVVSPPQGTFVPDPKFPEPERQARHQGRVELFVVINQAGQPAFLKVVHGLSDLFDGSALLTASRWRFKPAIKDGKAVAVAVNIDMNFRLY